MPGMEGKKQAVRGPADASQKRGQHALATAPISQKARQRDAASHGNRPSVMRSRRAYPSTRPHSNSAARRSPVQKHELQRLAVQMAREGPAPQQVQLIGAHVLQAPMHLVNSTRVDDARYHHDSHLGTFRPKGQLIEHARPDRIANQSQLLKRRTCRHATLSHTAMCAYLQKGEWDRQMRASAW